MFSKLPTLLKHSQDCQARATCEPEVYVVLVRPLSHRSLKIRVTGDAHRTYLQLGGHKCPTGHCRYNCMVGSYLQISGDSQNILVHTFTKHRKAKKNSNNYHLRPYFPYLRHHSWVIGKVTKAGENEHFSCLFCSIMRLLRVEGRQGSPFYIPPALLLTVQ